MPNMDGHELHRRCKVIDSELPVILITGHGDVSMAVRAMREGADDFLEKPYSSDALIESASRAVAKRALIMENRQLRAQLAAADTSGLIGRSPAIVKLRKSIAAVAGIDADVLISGETGAGKEIVARAVHKLGPRRERQFVALNCGALPEKVIESELFGHARGAFTGADRQRVGRIEHSNGGTLFLDEIESMPLDVQVKLLRVLQERSVEPLGSNDTVPVDLRVVAATKLDLRQLTREGRFRADLFYRLCVVNLSIPPLRERREDVPLLFAHFAAVAAMRYRRAAPNPDVSLLKQLIAHDWPGNVRELRNWAERFVLGIEESPIANERGTLAEQVDFYEKSLIEATLAAHNGDLPAVLASLGLPRKTFYDKLKRYCLSRGDFE
jgi:two-component system C4-dicarboxylate transport response regulator DctD